VSVLRRFCESLFQIVKHNMRGICRKSALHCFVTMGGQLWWALCLSDSPPLCVVAHSFHSCIVVLCRINLLSLTNTTWVCVQVKRQEFIPGGSADGRVDEVRHQELVRTPWSLNAGLRRPTSRSRRSRVVRPVARLRFDLLSYTHIDDATTQTEVTR